MNIEPCAINDIFHLIPEGLKADLLFPAHTEYWCIRDNGKVVAFLGMKFLGDRPHLKRVSIKSNYVIPEYRGRGLFKKLMDFQIEEARRRKCIYIDATCTEMSVREYFNRGFKMVKEYKKFTAVRMDL